MMQTPRPAAELLHRDGAVVGLALYGAVEVDVVEVMAVLRMPNGRLEGLRGVVPVEGDACEALSAKRGSKGSAVAFEAVMGFVTPGRHHGMEAKRALASFASANGLHGIGMGHEVVPLLGPFIRSLPGRVVSLFASHVHGLLLTPRLWHAVEGPDATGDTALARSLEERPLLARLVVQAHAERPKAFDAAVSATGGLDGLVADQAVRCKSVPRRLIGTLADAERCLPSYGAPALTRLRSVVPGIRPNDDIPVRFALLLRAVPPAWHPRGEDEWEAFVDLLPVMDVVSDVAIGMGSDAERAAVSLLAAGDGWQALRKRFADMVGTLDVAHAVNDVDDMLGAFEIQVVTPALALAGLNPHAEHLSHDMNAVTAATTLLLSGRSVASAVQLSVRWHRRRPAMEAALAALPGHVERVVSWPAGLPDAEFGGYRLSVLTSSVALGYEGRPGPDDRGVTGMGHCVGQYVDVCRAGKSRILSLSSVGPDGDVVRVSTAELGILDRDLFVRQHRGLRNEPVPADACRALYDYMDAITEGRSHVDWDAFHEVAPQGGGTNVLERDCGYEWRTPGHWERAFAEWAPFLRKGVRSLDLAAFASFADRLRFVPGRPPWLPDIALPGGVPPAPPREDVASMGSAA